MNHLFLLTVFFFSLCNTMSAAEYEKTISSADIKGITIFLHGAQVTRTAKINIESGITQCVFENLSANIDKKSILASGTGDITILSVVHQLNYLRTQQKTSELFLLEDSLESMNTDMEKLNNLKEIYKSEQDMLLANKSIGGANTGVTAEHLEDVADFIRKRFIEIKGKLMEININEKALNIQINKVRKQLNELNAKRDKPTSNITVAVSSKTKATIVLEISYMVSETGWEPVYDIRVKDINTPVQFFYKANVYQNTGEDWKNVKMKLSTGNPAQGGSKPDLETWWLDFYYQQPVSSMKKRMSFAGVQELKTVEINGSRMENNDAYIDGVRMKQASKLSDYIQVNQNQLSVDFDIALTCTILPDGKKYLIDVQNYELKAEYSYSVVPKIDKDAFLIAKVTGWDDLNLLSGQANIYFEGTYIGESYINVQNTNDTLELSLGRDKKIVVTREKQKDFSNNQFLGNNKIKTLTYEIAVRNTKKDIITITVEDQLPVPNNKDIEVKPIETGNAEYNEKTGKLIWKFNLPAGETQKRKFSFSVKYPKDKIIPNL